MQLQENVGSMYILQNMEKDKLKQTFGTSRQIDQLHLERCTEVIQITDTHKKDHSCKDALSHSHFLNMHNVIQFCDQWNKCKHGSMTMKASYKRY